MGKRSGISLEEREDLILDEDLILQISFSGKKMIVHKYEHDSRSISDGARHGSKEVANRWSPDTALEERFESLKSEDLKLFSE